MRFHMSASKRTNLFDFFLTILGRTAGRRLLRAPTILREEKHGAKSADPPNQLGDLLLTALTWKTLRIPMLQPPPHMASRDAWHTTGQHTISTDQAPGYNPWAPLSSPRHA